MARAIGSRKAAASAAIQPLDVWERLRVALDEGRAETVEPGFRTIRQWADEWDKSYKRAVVAIRQAHQRGIMERKVFRVNTTSTVRPVPHFKYVGE